LTSSISRSVGIEGGGQTQKAQVKGWNWRDRSTGLPSNETSFPAPTSIERESGSSARETEQKKGEAQTPDEELNLQQDIG
jgi:hypothetical protein